MTPKFSVAAVVAGAALLIAVPAWGQSQLPATYPDAVERATASKIASQSVPLTNLRAVLPSDAVESAIGATERSFAPQPFNLRTVVASDSVESAVTPRQFDLRHILASDARQMPKSVTGPTAIAASDSGSCARVAADRDRVRHRDPAGPRPDAHRALHAGSADRALTWVGLRPAAAAASGGRRPRRVRGVRVAAWKLCRGQAEA